MARKNLSRCVDRPDLPPGWIWRPSSVSLSDPTRALFAARSIHWRDSTPDLCATTFEDVARLAREAWRPCYVCETPSDYPCADCARFVCEHCRRESPSLRAVLCNACARREEVYEMQAQRNADEAERRYQETLAQGARCSHGVRVNEECRECAEEAQRS